MEQLSPSHPPLAACLGSDVRVPGTSWRGREDQDWGRCALGLEDGEGLGPMLPGQATGLNLGPHL